MDLTEILQVPAEKLVQKVALFDKDKLNFPVIVQEKYDGIFCLAYKYNNECHIYSRTGKEYFSMEHLKDSLLEMMNYLHVDMILFEAYVENTKQSIISGWCRDTVNQHKDLKAYCHDCLTFNEWNGDTSTYSIHFSRLYKAIEVLHNNSKITNDIKYVNYTVAFDKKDLNEFLYNIWGHDGEGVVIKNIFAYYERGRRAKTMMKIKRKITQDLRVVGVMQGTGKYENAVGALICKFKDSTISVGSGFTDKERFDWFENTDLIVGKIVELEAMSLTKNGKLREPIFKSVRYDKGVADF